MADLIAIRNHARSTQVYIQLRVIAIVRGCLIEETTERMRLCIFLHHRETIYLVIVSTMKIEPLCGH
jgi:high-affinity K+ transport system ATPase subunit B